MCSIYKLYITIIERAAAISVSFVHFLCIRLNIYLLITRDHNNNNNDHHDLRRKIVGNNL